ncbi:MAG: TerB family tellurite resistance protein [Halioglobus sp.]
MKALFEPSRDDTPETIEHQLNLAAAALLMETARADFTQDATEQMAMQNILLDTLNVSAQELEAVLKLAEERVDEATSLYQFTRLINDYYGEQQKSLLIQAMWRVAFADGEIDKYEEHLIRKVSDLIYVPHAEFVRLKLAAQKQQ